jgi:hypothetical protein
MKKTRRDIHKEIMYNKIMPTSHTRKNADSNDTDENAFGFYFHENAEDEEPEISEMPASVSQTEITASEKENNTEGDNDSIVKILSEYNEYKDKKAARKEQQESEDSENEDFSEDSDENQYDSEDNDISDDDDSSEPENIISQNKESQYPKLINIKEIMIHNKIDEVLEKFNCCKCDSCKLEITAIALNRLTPQYTICHSDEELEEFIPHSEYSKVTSALINAIITIRANPVHK